MRPARQKHLISLVKLGISLSGFIFLNLITCNDVSVCISSQGTSQSTFCKAAQSAGEYKAYLYTGCMQSIEMGYTGIPYDERDTSEYRRNP